MNNCCNIGNIKANATVGGIAGISEANIDNCFNTGNINSDTSIVGGIVGCNQNKITNCYNMGNITGTGTNIGGIVGLGQGDTIIENTYSKGIITLPLFTIPHFVRSYLFSSSFAK